MDIVKFEEVENRIIIIRDIPVLLDSDVAELYGVETKRINEAVSNNPEKFPEGYLFQLEKEEWDSLKSKISTLKNLGRGQHKKFLPYAFTEKGLYMLATILKSKQATQTTLMIIETFSKLRELGRNIKQMAEIERDKEKQSIKKRSGELISEIFDDELSTDGTETTIELNFAVLKLKHTIKKGKRKKE
jgi:phage regulator Rha-like protein